MPNNAIGFALEIPESVFSQIDRAQREIIKLEEQARTSADKINKSFVSLGDGGLEYFIKKLKEAQTAMAGIGFADTKGITAFANAMVEAANAVNRLGNTDKVKNIVPPSDDVGELRAELDRLNEAYDRLSKQRTRTTSSSNAQAKADREAAKAVDIYNRAMFANEGTITQRTNKIAKLREAERRLIETGRDYSSQITRIREETVRLSKENDRAATSTNKFRQQQGQLARTSEQLKRALSLVFSVSQMRGYALSIARVTGEFELQNRALQAILQNKDEADRLFGQITELAVRSPFQLKELVTYTKQLSAYRIESDKLFDTTKMLADVSAGLGVSMDRLILAYGQIKAAGYLRGTETRQLTEAGINVYGELADYYSELEGRIVSVNEVMDRQFKRMISFQDVEQIFKRLTEEGGIFFNMQELQADTVAGMMSNLQDSLDVMRNEIGNENEGMIKGVISTLRLLIENYQVVEGVLKSVSAAFAVYVVRAMAAAVANARLAKSTNAAAQRLLAMRKAQNIGTAFEKLGNSLSRISVNPIMLLVSAVTGLVVGLNKWRKAVEEARKEYDILSRRLLSTKDNLDSLVRGMEEQTRIYRESVREMSSLEEGTAEYTAASERAAAAEKERNTLLVKLKKDFPEVAAAYGANADSLESLIEAQQKYNKELEATLALNYAMERSHGWFDEGIAADLEDYSAAQKDYNNAVSKLREAFAYTRNEVEKMFAAFSKGEEEYRGTFDEIISGSDDVYVKMGALIEMLGQISTTSGGAFASSARGILRDINKDFNAAQRSTRKLQTAIREANSELRNMVDYALSQQGLASAEMFAGADTQIQELVKRQIEVFVRSLSSINDKSVQDMVNKYLSVTLGFTIDFGELPKQLDWLQKQINDYIKTHDLNVTPEIRVDELPETYFKSMQDSVKENIDLIERLRHASEQLQEGMSNEERIRQIEEENRQMTQLLRAFGYYDDELSGGGTNKAVQRLKERINLIKEMRREYEKMNKTYSAEDSARIVRESFEDTARELGMSGLVATMSFEPQGIIDAFDVLMRQVVANIEGYSSDVVKQLELALKKAADNYRVEVGVDAVIERRESIREEFEDMFSGYTLTMEVEDMGMDKNTAQRLFGLDVVTLDDIKKKLEEVRGELTGEDGLKLYQQLSGKIQDIEAKALMDRMRTYSEYMKKSISERAALEIAAAKEVVRIRSTEGLSSEVQDALLRRLQEETTKARADMDWKDFQESDIYVRMFEELEYVSDMTLQRMKQRLDDIRASIGDAFSPEQMKAFMSAYSDIESQIISRNPFKSLAESMREIRDLEKAGRSESALEQELLVYEAQKESFERQTADLETIIGLKEANIKFDSLSGDFLERNKDLMGMSVEQLRAMVAANKLAVSGLETDIGIDEADLRVYSKARQSLMDVSDTINSIRSIGGQAFDSIKQILEDMGVESDSVAMTFVDMGVSLLDMVAQAVMFGMQLKLLTAQAEILGTAMNSALGPIGWIALALQALATVVSAAFNAADKKRQEAIDAEMDKIDELERRYEELEDAVDSALSIEEGRRTSNAMLSNLERQLDAYERALALEQSQKASNVDEDAVAEYKQGIEDVKKEMDSMRDYLSDLGGFGSQENIADSAQDFIDTWMEAYKETGDGLDALIDKWDEYYENIVAKQMMLRVTEKYLQPIMDLVDTALEDWELSPEEAEDIRKNFERIAPELNEVLKRMAEMYGVLPGGDGGDMSDLQKGIQSITETTGQALEALFNSVRFFVADSNSQLRLLVSSFSGTEGFPNPMLDELRNHTRLLTAISTALSSVIKSGHPDGGYGIKTFM